MGIGFVDYTPYLLPLTFGFLLIALSALFYRAKNRHGYKPFYLGVCASAILLIGKFMYENDIAMYIGLGLLVIASIWNTWPVRRQGNNMNCPACVVAEEKVRNNY